MAKRFTDTEKWKKPFIRSLKAPYKLLWLYVCDDCDHAGIWQVDLEVAEIRIGIKLNLNEAIKSYGDKIIVFDNGNKWFIPSFIEFQYPSGLNPQNNAHIGIIKTLEKYQLEINQIKPLNSPLTAPMDMDMVMDKEMDKVKVMVILPFESENFYNYWSLWKDYKHKQLNFKFKTPQSEQASLKDLVTLSKGDEQTAIKIIEQSMAKGWKGLFALKNENYATGTSQGSKPNYAEREFEKFKSL
jgi:hypothetical protein